MTKERESHRPPEFIPKPITPDEEKRIVGLEEGKPATRLEAEYLVIGQDRADALRAAAQPEPVYDLKVAPRPQVEKPKPPTDQELINLLRETNPYPQDRPTTDKAA